MDILVINLMRLGDLAQTGPVLRRLRAEYAGGRISLLVMDLFGEPAGLLPNVDRLLTFPSSTLASLLDREGGWPEAAGRLGAWLAATFPQPPDLVVNLTPNLLAGLLAHATGTGEIRGLAVDRTWEVFTRPSWASYALVVSRARLANPFNLVDLFLREAGLTPDGRGLELHVPPGAAREVDEHLRSLSLPPGTALVGLVPGASRPERSWPPEQFARAAALLLRERPGHFFIFGSSGEAPLGEAVARDLPAGATTLLLGRTGIPGLAAYLQRLHLLITNDTGPMHLAAAVGAPVLALFLASARVQDTGPVGSGHLILEPRLTCHPCLAPCPEPRCHRLITPEAVAGLGGRLLEGEPLGLLAEGPPWETCRVSLATTDPLGYHAYLPLVRRPLTRQDFWRWLHRLVWDRVLDGSVRPGNPLSSWVGEVLARFYDPPRDDLGWEAGQDCLAALSRVAARGVALAGEILELSRGGGEFSVRLWQQGEALRTIDPEVRRLGVAFPEALAFIEFFFQEQQAAPPGEAAFLARELQETYRRLEGLGAVARECLIELEKICRGMKKDDKLPKKARNVHSIMPTGREIQTVSHGPLVQT